ncbi:Squamosa promoter-binding-like protein [Musa troglodytarum]|uniref:Squamosa promoter-binding-like protein n=1 Tax=Musa troglodytarum TaxID=320322 RepID=A0A9E7FV45_9LILI|nr:Squamosa promoter-binding-like protein [Musa troglodytarum]
MTVNPCAPAFHTRVKKGKILPFCLKEKKNHASVGCSSVSLFFRQPFLPPPAHCCGGRVVLGPALRGHGASTVGTMQLYCRHSEVPAGTDVAVPIRNPVR